jgi:magnesium transporter
MITVVYSDSQRRVGTADHVDPAWLRPESTVVFWADVARPSKEDSKLLTDVFKFHELSVEDALATSHHPKIEPYDGYLYVILHGIDSKTARTHFSTRDIDFFLTEKYLVTVHDGQSRSIAQVREMCTRNGGLLADGPAGLMHHIVDTMVDNYRPEIDRLEQRMDKIEREVFTRARHDLIRSILALKRDIVLLRQVVQPQRDVLGRLARREFQVITPQVGYRFRDVYDHLVRLSDESLIFQDRATSLVEAHLSAVSNQLNNIMKILTVIATIFMPLTFVTGLYGMNVELPHFGVGDHAMFWVLMGVMLAIVGGMLWFFHHREWL